MSDVDTMRWGDVQSIPIRQALAGPGQSGEGTPGIATSSQILNAHWQRPCVWRLLFSLQPFIQPVDIGITFAVNVLLRLGVGQANAIVPLAIFPFGPALYANVVQFFDVPAENLQLQFQVGNVVPVGGPLPDPGTIVVCSAFVAPRAEPGGIVQVRDHMSRGIREPDQDGHPRWMPPGFEDGELRYR